MDSLNSWPAATRAGLAVMFLFTVTVHFLVSVLPANIHAARAGVTLRGNSATPLAVRIPMQILFVALIWWPALASGS